jgi:hypothetical protein
MARRCKHIEELYDPLATILIGASRFRTIVLYPAFSFASRASC